MYVGEAFLLESSGGNLTADSLWESKMKRVKQKVGTWVDKIVSKAKPFLFSFEDLNLGRRALCTLLTTMGTRTFASENVASKITYVKHGNKRCGAFLEVKNDKGHNLLVKNRKVNVPCCCKNGRTLCMIHKLKMPSLPISKPAVVELLSHLNAGYSLHSFRRTHLLTIAYYAKLDGLTPVEFLSLKGVQSRLNAQLGWTPQSKQFLNYVSDFDQHVSMPVYTFLKTIYQYYKTGKFPL